MTQATQATQGTQSMQATETTRSTGQTDFDFLIGTWKVHNRKLRERLAGSTEWDEFPATTVERPLWGGRGNLEEWEGDGPKGPIRGMALRLFDPRAGQWSIYWADSSTGVLDPPMIGEFKDGRGEFFAQERCNGRGVLCRFVWSDVTPVSCRWEQALSADGGRSWEVNWIMEFTRAS